MCIRNMRRIHKIFNQDFVPEKVNVAFYFLPQNEHEFQFEVSTYNIYTSVDYVKASFRG